MNGCTFARIEHPVAAFAEPWFREVGEIGVWVKSEDGSFHLLDFFRSRGNGIVRRKGF
jgi:hypothetical protein